MLRIDRRPSRILVGALVLAHGLALCAVWISFGGWARALAAVAILTSLADTVTGALLRTGRSVVSLELHEDGRASWRERDGKAGEGALGRSHFVSPFLVVLELKPADQRARRVIFLADSATPDDFRRLKVWLRWRGKSDRPEAE
jgi:toxin CptA